MNLNLVRKIDYWAGIPASIVISVFYKFGRFFPAKRTPKDEIPKKIIFLELSEIGSAILAYSAIKKVREIYPGVKLYFWIFKENAESVTLSGVIPKENIIQISSRNLFVLLLDTIRAISRIRKEKIDTLIDLELFSRFTSIISYLSGAKKRAGFYRFSMEGLYRSDIYTHKVIYNPYMHISKNFLSLAYSLKSPDQERPLLKGSLANEATVVPDMQLSNEAKENIWSKLKAANKNISNDSKLVILNLGVGDYLYLRNWPLENYLKLAEKLLEKGVFIILVGIKYGLGQKERIGGLLKQERCVDLIGKTNIKELVDLCSVSNLLISHDSGVANLASLTSISSIIMFGPETPVLYAPLNPNAVIIYKNFACSPCLSAYNHRNSVCRENLCLQAISVDEVFNKAVALSFNGK